MFDVHIGDLASAGCSVCKMLADTPGDTRFGKTTAVISGVYYPANTTTGASAYTKYTLTFKNNVSSYNGYWWAVLAGNMRSNQICGVEYKNI